MMRLAGFGSVGVVLAIVAACGGDDEGGDPANTAGRAGGDAGRGGSAGRAGSSQGGTAGSRSGGAAGESAATGGSGAGEAGSGGEAGSVSPGGSGAGGDAGGRGEPGSFLPSFGRGSRLDVKELRAGNMPPVFVTFYDSELEQDCSFTAAADGSLRCLPRSTSTNPFISPNTFLDDECTVRVALGGTTCVAEADGITTEVLPGTGCEESRTRVYRARLLDDGLPLYSTSTGSCAAAGQTGAGAHHFGLEELVPEDFVAATIEIPPTPTRLSVQRLSADDGAHQSLALADPEADASCRAFEGLAGQAMICVPAVEWSGRGWRFADDECSEPLSLPVCERPLYVVDVDDETQERSFYEAGPEHTGAVYGGVSTCELVTGEGPFWAIGDPVPRSRFASVTSDYQGTGRLRHRVFADAAGTSLISGSANGGSILSEGGLFDTEFGEECSVRRYTDGEMYCLPHSLPFEVWTNRHYADASCTEPIVLCGQAGCPTDFAVLQEEPASGGCGSPADFSALLRLGDELELAEYYTYDPSAAPGSECRGPTPAEGSGSIREVTGETDADALVQLERAGG